MANQQLVDYIKSQTAAGVSRADLEKVVATAGWPAKDASDAFAVADGKVPVIPVPPPAPKPAPVIVPAQPQPAASQPVQPVQKPVTPVVAPVQTMPVTPVSAIAAQSMTVRPVMAQESAALSFGSGRRLWPWITLAAVALVVLLVAAAYFLSPTVQAVVGFYLGSTPAQPAPAEQAPAVAPQEPLTIPDLSPATTTATSTASTASTTPAATSTTATASTTVGQ